MQMKAGDLVYVRRGKYLAANKVDHTYIDADGTFCVAFISGPSAPASDVMTYDEYRDNQRARSAQCK